MAGRKSFLNGLFAGGLIGAILGLFVLPQRQPEYRKKILGKTRTIKNTARKVMKDVSNGIDNLIKE